MTVRQASGTHIEKPRHFKTAIAAEPEVVSIIRKNIWNYHVKFYIFSFVLMVTKILSSELLAYKGSSGITRQKFPVKSFYKKNHKNIALKVTIPNLFLEAPYDFSFGRNCGFKMTRFFRCV